AASVITATTAQNTTGVIDIHAIPATHLEKQLEAVFSDIHFSAVKIGMLHSCEVMEVISTKLHQYEVKNIVLDPVMVATSGDKLINDNAIDCLKKLLPKADLITPNTQEAEILIGHTVDRLNIAATAREIGRAFNTSVLLKGGHLEDRGGEMSDILYDIASDTHEIIYHPRVHTKNTHGTGCSLSSSIAAFLARGLDLETAVRNGCNYVNQAIMDGKDKVLGKGNGPINHFGLK
ncbi:MAG: bifunctional hydroxymethylpyrimidine kinase/phosphomethylpyrimidine kinase, partial [Ekhidna sp.]|nr:bifunctional hydroxymethylpyrimidine kinase/phosphomethylpyrimidine kinase [Ekhidna sp.]